jgi:hypothetical protein
MRIKEEDLRNFAKLFKDLSNGKYKVAIISQDEEEYLYDLTLGPEDGFDFLVVQTLTASFNTVLLDQQLKKEEPPLIVHRSEVNKVRVTDETNNPYLWSTIPKTKQ